MATITNRQSIKIGATFSEYAISQCPERMLSIRKFLQGPRVVRRSPKARQNQRKQWMPAETSSNPTSFCNISNQFVAANNWKYTIFKEFLWKNVKKIDYISNDSSPLARLKNTERLFVIAYLGMAYCPCSDRFSNPNGLKVRVIWRNAGLCLHGEQKSTMLLSTFDVIWIVASL